MNNDGLARPRIFDGVRLARRRRPRAPSPAARPGRARHRHGAVLRRACRNAGTSARLRESSVALDPRARRARAARGGPRPSRAQGEPVGSRRFLRRGAPVPRGASRRRPARSSASEERSGGGARRRGRAHQHLARADLSYRVRPVGRRHLPYADRRLCHPEPRVCDRRLSEARGRRRQRIPQARRKPLSLVRDLHRQNAAGVAGHALCAPRHALRLRNGPPLHGPGQCHGARRRHHPRTAHLAAVLLVVQRHGDGVFHARRHVLGEPRRAPLSRSPDGHRGDGARRRDQDHLAPLRSARGRWWPTGG